jgi:hypothetical protein
MMYRQTDATRVISDVAQQVGRDDILSLHRSNKNIQKVIPRKNGVELRQSLWRAQIFET